MDRTAKRVFVVALLLCLALFLFGTWQARQTGSVPMGQDVPVTDVQYVATTVVVSVSAAPTTMPAVVVTHSHSHAPQTSIAEPRSVSTTQPARTTHGVTHSCTASGSVVTCWGSNVQGELGGTFGGKSGSSSQQFPAVVDDVQAGDHDSCALAGGRVSCWGWRAAGDVPLENVKHLSVGMGQTCASTQDGDVARIYCWGEGWTNENDSLGTPSASPYGGGYDGAHFTNIPVLVWEGRHVHSLDAGYRNATAHVGFGGGVCGFIIWGQGEGFGTVRSVQEGR